MKRILAISFILFVAASTTILISCRKHDQGANGGADGPPTTGDWLIVRLGADPDTFNPLTTTTTDGSEIGGLCMYESLTSVDENTLAQMPVIADTLPIISADRLHYTYRLKKNVKFSDGVGVTGEDFICYLKTLKNGLIINAAAQRSYYKSVQKVEIVNNDPYTIMFTMSEPYALGYQWCGGAIALPKHIWDPKGLNDKISWEELNDMSKIKNNAAAKEYAEWFEDAAKGRDPKFLIGSGKYIFESWETSQKVVLHRNPNYWNAGGKYGTAYIDKIVYRVIQDENAALTALKGGEIDFMPNVPKAMYVTAFDSVKNRDIAHRLYDYPVCSFIKWNLHNPLFQDQRVRLALAKLTNSEEIIKTMLKGMAVQLTGDTYFHRPEYDTTLKPIAFDPEGAKQLLADAGWKDTDGDGILDKDGKKFEFTIMTVAGSAISDKILLIPIEAMRKAGISADMQRLEFSIYVANSRGHKFEAEFGGLGTSVSEGDEYQLWHSTQTVGGSNTGYYNNPQVDSLIVANRGEFDELKRRENHKRIQQIIFNDQPAAFLYAVKLAGAWNARFKNVNFYAPRPSYDYSEWFVPKEQQKYGKTGQ